MFIQDPEYDLFYPGSRVYKIPDPDLHKKILSIFNPKNSFLVLKNKVQDVHSGSRG